MNTKISRVIAVCGSNTLRSPTFEKILQLELSKAGLTHIQVTSAGVDKTQYGQPADPKNATYMLEYHGIQLENHRSREVTEVSLTDTDLIVIAGGYVDRMSMESRYSPKTYHYLRVRNGEGIDSPYCSSTPRFNEMKAQIDEAVLEVVAFLQNQS